MFASKSLLLTLMVASMPSISAVDVNKTGIIQSSVSGECWYMGDYPQTTDWGVRYDNSHIYSRPCNLTEPRQFFTYLGASSNLMSQLNHDCVDAWYEAAKDYHVKMWQCHENEAQQHWNLDGVEGLKTKQSPSGFCMFTDTNEGIIKSIPCDDTKKEVFKFYVQPPPPSIVTPDAPVAVMAAEKPAVKIPDPVVVPHVAGGATGDPHMIRFGGDKYDFHGGCDLVLLSNPGFANGLGLHVHIRTKIESWWSFIESAVVKLGDHTLELKGGAVGEGAKYWVNGLPGDEFDVPTELLDMIDSVRAHLPGFDIHYHHIDSKQHRFRFDLNGDAISLSTYKSWVAVQVHGVNDRQFAGSLGLMGSFPTGALVARDGLTVETDTNAFAQQWQVLSSEPMLFHEPGDGVHHPEQCAMPSASQKKSRRLGESGLTEDAAALACARVKAGDQDSCIFDVLASNDIDMAGAY